MFRNTLRSGIATSHGTAIFVVVGTEVWTQGFTLAKQAINCLSYTVNKFCSGCVGDELSRAICLGWPQTMILTISDSGTRPLSHFELDLVV
jgi:hypothetical protein